MANRPVPFPSWPHFDTDEIAEVAAVLASGKVNYWTGHHCKAFEREFATYHGRRYAISLTNGSAALELALHALGVGAGDEVVVPSRTFIASASCAAVLGAVPVVADVDVNSQNLTVDTVRQVLSPRTKAIVAVHLGGWPCDIDAITELAREHGIWVIEDCAQAHGARLHGRPVGAFGDAAAFSFCQDKIMTTGGEGGMLLLDDELAWNRAWSFKDHGKAYDKVANKGGNEEFQWLHDSFGTNLRMTEMQAALGRLQLRKLPGWLAVRRRNAEILAQALASVYGLRVPMPSASIEHAYYRFYAFIEPSCLSDEWTRDRVIQAIRAEGIPCFVGSCGEIYRERAFAAAGLAPPSRRPVAAGLAETSLAFLVHPTISESDVRDVAAIVRRVMNEATVK